MKKVKIAAVSYLNTKPLLYGFFLKNLDRVADISLHIPSECAQKLRKGEVDLGLIPVAAIPEIDTPYIISDYCIGAIGAVRTVKIYGMCPIEEMETIYLDFHSRTSIELAKILLDDYWKLTPKLVSAPKNYIIKIKNKIGGVIIGDRCIDLENKYPYHYDLSEAWLEMTGLPFVFAAWVSNKKLPEVFIKSLNEAMRLGIERKAQISFLLGSRYKAFDLLQYYSEYISYNLDTEKKKALNYFLEKINKGNNSVLF